MSMENSETTPSKTSGSMATRVAAMVITALVYGVLVYVSRFAPKIFGMQMTFPAAGIAPAVGIWFGGWGAIGAILGTIISQLPAGMNPMMWVPANLGQLVIPVAYFLFYKKNTVKSMGDYVSFIVIGTISTAITLVIVDLNVVANGFVPDFGTAMRVMFPVQMLGNLIWVFILGPISLNVVSPYIVKAGLKAKSLL